MADGVIVMHVDLLDLRGIHFGWHVREPGQRRHDVAHRRQRVAVKLCAFFPEPGAIDGFPAVKEDLSQDQISRVQAITPASWRILCHVTLRDAPFSNSI